MSEPIGHESAVKVGLVAVLLGLAGTAGAAHYRLGKAEEDILEVKQAAAERMKADQTQELRLQRIDDKLEVIQLTLREIWELQKKQEPPRKVAPR